MNRRISTLAFSLILWAVGGHAWAHPGGIDTTDPALPPNDGFYKTPTDVFAVYVAPGPGLTVRLSDVRLYPHRDQPNTYAFGDEFHDFDADLTGMVSVNASPALPILLEGRVQTLAHSKGPGSTGTFQTEMLAMSLSGNNVMMRESPTVPSLGITSINPSGGGLYHIDSFFDVFTELSLDGGQTWMPSATGPSHIYLTPEPTSAALVATGVVGFAGFARRRKNN